MLGRSITEIDQLKEFDVDVVTIGDDWVDKHLEGLEWMKKQPGKEVVYLPYTPGISTSSIKREIIEDSHKIIEAQLQRELENMELWKNRQ